MLAYRPAHSSPLAGGRGARHVSFAALADDSDSDAESPPPPLTEAEESGCAAAFAALACYTASAEFRALADGSTSWGDIFLDPLPPAAAAAERAMWTRVSAARRLRDAQDAGHGIPSPPPPEPVLQLRGTEADFWANDFARNLEMRWWNVYDATDLTDSEYAAMMTWLYDKGWLIEQETRTIVQAQEDDLPPRRWIAGLRDAPGAGHGPPAPLAAPGTDAGRRRGAPVPRFCRAAGACAEAGCRYVHGDTIPRINAPCSFGDACGATDPTGVKRSQCLRMHPGEVWTEGMVIRRPPSA